MIEVKSLALEFIAIHSNKIIHFSSANDPRWTGIQVLAPRAIMQINPIGRNDVYVIRGKLFEQGREHIREHSAGTFLTRSSDADLSAGDEGAILFVYRDGSFMANQNMTIAPDALEWYETGTDGMRAAALSDDQYRVSLVAWKPGTKINLHAHRFGEEIFVLEGELCDQRGRYPAGTWLRLYSDESHAPYAEIDTVILLRNGHLRG